ncbi:restriction endonuclease-like protein [Vibrio cholerae]|uniref:DUF2357 domain-containing protein n=1 Tax=Vibrio paracholerae TaxID=650003 RepID=A0ABD7FY00_9VIBR|nr:MULTISPECIES: DUF2357 domain-containing protein [Vibrio]MBP8547603.1 DUF2357 domain-containing protein [Vibrio paracholerae]MEB5520127.1 DUF2357 domain-containing protein [Vibrio cholerae]RBM71295.1 hypothetical protein DLR72_04275 [Vibrio paracholerae]TXX50768.1 DUF2357 domain-containing protein [Vibrio cholerae]
MAYTERETITYSHDDFDIFITSDKLGALRNKLANTYEHRGLNAPHGCFVFLDEKPFSCLDGGALEQVFFFENKAYWVEIEFKDSVNPQSTNITHKYRLLEQSFSKSPRRNALQAMLNFGNDVGRCELTIEYSKGEQLFSSSLSFTVFATKMLIEHDLQLMNQKLDEIYPFWRYAVSGKTTQQHTKSSNKRAHFELFWLAQFERLVEQFNRAVKHILVSPHNRLQSTSRSIGLDRLKGALSVKKQEKANELIASKRANVKIVVTSQKLALDTPENRFVKYILRQTKSKLTHILGFYAGEESNFSESFLLHLQSWQHSVECALKHSMWREVGNFEGLASSSKVLQQANGYAKVYQIWQQLKYYLEQSRGDANLAVKSVAEIYEVWCFTEVLSLVKALGFVELTQTAREIKHRQFITDNPKDEMASAFELVRHCDGMRLEIAHEPKFNPKGDANRTWLGTHKPDIVIRATLANNESFFILFDAKYRIDSQQFKNMDGVPIDAINQMHRYRDAIIHQTKHQFEAPSKSRPVKGAFALYPGFFTDQNVQNNPYSDAINEIGIGAFALLPSGVADQQHNVWLKQYLEKALGNFNGDQHYSGTSNLDYYFIEDAARITPYGISPIRHFGLTMIAPINEIERTPEYIALARNGKLGGYHTQLIATNRQNIHRNVIREIRYCVLTVRDSDDDTLQYGRYLYRVKNVKLLPRNQIDITISGKESRESHFYWQFEFDSEPLKLNNSVSKTYEQHFEFKLLKAEHLPSIRCWQDICGDLQVYSELSV